MATSVVFDLIDTLVDQLTSVLAAKVYDAFGEVSEEPGDYLVIGFDDPNADQATSAEAKQEWAGLGARHRYEEGTVTCLALSWNGDSDMRAARAGVKAITAAVEDHLRADPNLGGAVPGLNWTGFGVRHELESIPAEDGACVTCVFDIAFKARI